MNLDISAIIDKIVVFGCGILTDPTEIHVEDIFQDRVYEKLLAHVKNHDCMCMLTTPHEYEYCRANHAFKYSREEFERILRERYTELKKHSDVGLHTHLARGPSIDRLNYEEQRKKLSDGLKFLRLIGLEVTDFAPGWWSWNQDTVRACKDLGIKYFHLLRGRERRGNVRGIKLVVVNNYCHDFNL